jgi:hypothetical protein
MGRKTAIFDNDEIIKFLRNAKSLENEVRTYMMVAFGVHPENLRRLTADKKGKDRITKDGLLEFRRAKNYNLRRELLSPEVAEVIYDVVRRGKLRISNTFYEKICAEQGDALEHYHTPPVTPMTLLHTFSLNELRRMRKGGLMDLELVSGKMGCTIQTVRQNYLDMKDWERITQKEFSEPLDLTHWKFQNKI